MGDVNVLKDMTFVASYEIDDTFDSDKFIKMRMRICHDGLNPNNSFLELDTINNAEKSIYNIPILANVIEDENGEKQFGGHDMAIEEHAMNEGEYKVIYKETPIGVIPESCNHTIEEYDGKNYVFADAYIWKEYSNYAEDIINRDNDIKISMEILVDAYEFNAKDKYFKINEYRYTGVTMLNNDFGTGMKNALATTGEFSQDETKTKFIMLMEELKQTLDIYNKKESGGESIVADTKKNSEEEIVEDVANEDVENSEVEENENLENEDTQENTDSTKEDSTQEFEETENVEDTTENVEEEIEENNTEDESNSEEETDETIETSEEKFVKTFELSHQDIRYALYNLLAPIEGEDGEWYFIDQVYDDRFEYENWEGTKIYRQGYKKDGDNISFEGERVELFQERLTKEEKEVLDQMRSEYSQIKADFEAMSKELESLSEYKKAKDNEEKEVIFNQFDGLNEEDVKDVRKNIDNYSISELEKELLVVWAKKKREVEKFSDKTEKNTEKLLYALNNTVEDGNKPIYADIVEKHNN